MSVYVGDKKATVFHGDQHPAEIWGPSTNGIPTTGKNLFNEKDYNKLKEGFGISLLKEGETYTISSNKYSIRFKISDSRGGHVSVDTYTSNKAYTFVMNRNPNISESKEQLMFFQVQGAKWVTDPEEIKGLDIQVELGDKATSYEPYTGGKPGIFRELVKYSGFDIVPKSGTDRLESVAPYNAAVQNVRVQGNVVQERLTGKNLIPFPYYVLDGNIMNGLTIKILDDRSIQIDGTATGSPNSNAIIPLSSRVSTFFPAGTYYIGNLPSNDKQVILACSLQDEHGQNLINISTSTGGSGIVLYLREDAYSAFVNLQIPVGTTLNKEIFKIQLEKGNKHTEYEPPCGGIPAPNPGYQIMPVFWKGSVESRGKNLFNVGKTTHTGIYNERGEYLTKDQRLWSNLIAVAPGEKITMKTLGVSSENEQIAINRIILYDKNQKFLRRDNSGILQYIYTFTVPKDTYFVVYDFRTAKLTTPLNASDLDGNTVINKGGKALPWQPYFDGGTATIPTLRALSDGSIRDEYDVQSGILTRRIGEYRFTGNEVVIQNAQVMATSNKVAYDVFYNIPIVATYVEICNKFEVVPWNGFYVKNSASFLSNQVVFATDGVQSAKDFKNYLKLSYESNEPVTVWYALETPIIEHVPPVTLHQHPGYTQLIANANLPTAIEAEFYEESAT